MAIYQKILVAIITFLILGFVLNFTLIKGSNKKTVVESTDISIGLKWLHQAQFAGMYVAKDKGFYQEHGINVDLKEFKAGESTMDNVINGAMQFGLTSANDLLTSHDDGKDIKAIGTIYQASPYVVVSLKGAQILTPRDLKGKRLGVKGGSGAEGAPIFDLLLSSAGLEQSDVEIVPLDFSTTEKEDLLAGTVDAIGLYRTRLYLFEQEGITFNAIFPEQYGTPVYNDVIFASNKFLSENPLVTKAFLEATIEGWEYALKHQEEALDIVMTYVADESYLDRGYQSYILSSSVPLIKPSTETRIGEMSRERWQRFQDALKNRGAIKNDLDINKAFTNEFL